MEYLKDLVKVSQFYGKDKNFVLAGGGNTSFKDKDRIWVKASGKSLSNITLQDFVVLDRKRLDELIYSKNSIEEAVIYPKDLKPSVESFMHHVLEQRFVVHTHPWLINVILCSKDAKVTIEKLFPEFTFIPYIEPGYKLAQEIKKLSKKEKREEIFFLQNHGIVVAADKIEDIKRLTTKVIKTVKEKIKVKKITPTLQDKEKAFKLLPAIRMILSKDSIKILAVRKNSIIDKALSDERTFYNLTGPFTPDEIVYCGKDFIFYSGDCSEKSLYSLSRKIENIKKENGKLPKIIGVKDVGIVAADTTFKGCETSLDLFEESLKIGLYSRLFGGPSKLQKKDISFIDNWELERYRKKIFYGSFNSKLEGKIAIITGAAQGFGEGITRDFFKNGANVVIADINIQKGKKLEEELNLSSTKNRAIFIKTDVSSEISVKDMIKKTVMTFGGIDILVSNAGILRAGSLEEISFDIFKTVTSINYEGYFLCVKYATEVMKTQNRWLKNYWMDIIQINSKSGLQGSNKNFAYAGAKFGAIGLTQSFALELLPFKIKVNSICPGNYFEGPLWSDPKNGLFIQYLKTGKVPGAKTVNDVKKFYESKIPAGRGCRIKDLMTAIYYLIDQEYETGQALPVTGGQIMLH